MTAEQLAGALVLLVAAVVCLVAVRAARRRLPGDDWFREPGAAFAADEHRRRERHDVARDDAQQLAAAVAAGAASLEGDWREPADGIARSVIAAADHRLVDLMRRLDARERGAADLTISLYGRTKAGKSSLFAALAGRGFEGIGDGRQNFTRDNRSEMLGSVRLIDAPGVDGVGSEPLEALTADAVHEADILVVAVTDDAVFAEDFERLEALGASARPVVIALNVKQANLKRLIEQPGKVFRRERLEPHVRRLRKALPDHSRNDTPVVVYHALAAERARRATRTERVSLWEGSRIADVIGAIRECADQARRFALLSADEAVARACEGVLEACADATRETDARVQGVTRALAEVEGILQETAARKQVGAQVADGYFASAEAELLAAIELHTTRAFGSRADKVLNTKALNRRLKEVLDETAELLQEKFADFEADLRLAARVSTARSRLDDLHERLQHERTHRQAAEQKARKRKWWRLGAKAVGSLAVVLASETVVGGAVAVVAAERIVDKLFPDIEVPVDDPRHRIAVVREIISGANAQAIRAFDEALESQILMPARAQLVDPLRVQLSEFARLRHAIDEMASPVRGIYAGADERLYQRPPEKELTAA